MFKFKKLFIYIYVYKKISLFCMSSSLMINVLYIRIKCLIVRVLAQNSHTKELQTSVSKIEVSLRMKKSVHLISATCVGEQ